MCYRRNPRNLERSKDADRKLIHRITPQTLDAVWPHAEPLLKKALDTSEGEINTDQCRLLLVKGMADLFMTDDLKSCALVEWFNYPNYRAANVIAIGGRGVFQYWDEFREWLKLGGASRIRACCKPAQSRLFRMKLGFRPIYETMDKEL